MAAIFFASGPKRDRSNFLSGDFGYRKRKCKIAASTIVMVDKGVLDGLRRLSSGRGCEVEAIHDSV
jgi:hypothetical protein